MTTEDLKTFIVDYEYQGSKFSFYLIAKSWDDAEDMLRAIKQKSEIVGQLTDIIPWREQTSLDVDHHLGPDR